MKKHSVQLIIACNVAILISYNLAAYSPTSPSPTAYSTTVLQAEDVSSQKIELRFADAAVYVSRKEVPITAAMIQKIDIRKGQAGESVFVVTLTNMKNLDCSVLYTQIPELLQTEDDFALSLLRIKSFDKKGPESSMFHMYLYDEWFRAATFNLSPYDLDFYHLSAKNKNYHQRNVVNGTGEILRNGDKFRLTLRYEDKKIAASGDVELKLCPTITIDAPKK